VVALGEEVAPLSKAGDVSPAGFVVDAISMPTTPSTLIEHRRRTMKGQGKEHAIL